MIRLPVTAPEIEAKLDTTTAAISSAETVLTDIAKHLASIDNSLKILAFVAQKLVVPKKPTILRHVYKGEDEMEKQVYDFAWNPVDPNDRVNTRELKINVDGDDIETRDFQPADDGVTDLKFPTNAKVKLTLVDIDKSGNRSGEDVYEFDATDTVPPATPQGLGGTWKGTVDEP